MVQGEGLTAKGTAQGKGDTFLQSIAFIYLIKTIYANAPKKNRLFALHPFSILKSEVA